jgi:tRNA(Ile)-lysidine synthase
MLPKTSVGHWATGSPSLQSFLDQSPADGLSLIRPLLTTSRAEVEAYCAEQDLHPVQDASNLDTTYFRNRLRHELLPYLETYNPNIRQTLRRMAEVVAGEYDLVRRAVDDVWQDAAAQVEADRVVFDKARWRALSVPEQRALLRESVRQLRPDLRDADFAPLDGAVRFSRTAQSGRTCDLFGGLRLSLSSAHVTVSAWGAEPQPGEFPLLDVAGQLNADWQFCMETFEPGEWSRDDVEGNTQGWRVEVDADKAQALCLRARLPGDRFQPLGMQGHSLKVSDFMINAKVDEALRDRWPLVVSGGEIVWVAGLRLDERFKVAPETRAVTRLWFEKSERSELGSSESESR